MRFKAINHNANYLLIELFEYVKYTVFWIYDIINNRYSSVIVVNFGESQASLDIEKYFLQNTSCLSRATEFENQASYGTKSILISYIKYFVP